ncbi:MAG: hypothetical protein Q8M98_05655 [Candidatus Cloacimonadaceae bacterium]|nr:hypothetical protein [Candidatus Cloacimonadaceae bacterium]
MDNCENLVNVFSNITAKSLLTILAHFSSVNNITMMLINTINHGESNEITEVCQAIADNVFLFQKINLLGNWYPTMRVTRSSRSLHNEVTLHVYRRQDGLLELLDSFSLIKNFACSEHALLPIRIFAPGNSKEFIQFISDIRFQLERTKLLDDFEVAHAKIDNQAIKSALKLNYGTIKSGDVATVSTINEWHNYIKEMISASLSHQDVSITTKPYSISDVSIVLDNESVKDAVTLQIIPGHLLHRYLSNLLVISDYINFYNNPALDYNKKFAEHFVTVDDNYTSITFETDNQSSRIKKCILGKSYYFMHTSSTKIASTEEEETFIIPDILFNPAIDRYPTTGLSTSPEHGYKIRLKDVKEHGGKYALVLNYDDDGKPTELFEGRIDVRAYPFYIDPRIDLIIRKGKDVSPQTKDNYIYKNHSAEDYFATFCELNSEERQQEQLGVILTNSYEKQNDLLCNIQDLGVNKTIVIRDWYSAHQELINTVLQNQPDFFEDYQISYVIPTKFLYQTWYLGVPNTSPRKDLACEIMVKMTEPHDMETLKILGLGIPVNRQAYAKKEKKYFPSLEYEKLLEKLKTSNAVPVSYMLCYYKLVTPIGGALRNLALATKSNNSKDNQIGILVDSYLKLKNSLCKSCLLKGERCPLTQPSSNNTK